MIHDGQKMLFQLHRKTPSFGIKVHNGSVVKSLHDCLFTCFFVTNQEIQKMHLNHILT